MQCPTDGSTLTMAERSGIEIDYCPQCRGVWLDRGELDKLIERSATMQAPAQPQPQPSSYERERDERRQQQERRYTDPYQPAQYQQQPYRKKKESWLSEFFD
jgi:Zn-finger nucleic acid-binding protein